MPVENNDIEREEGIIASIMNIYFTNITTQLKLKPTRIDPKANLKSITNTFQNHENVLRFKLANFHSKSSLTFNRVSELNVKKEILSLSSEKATRKGDIPAKILKNSINIYLSDSKVFERILFKQNDSFMENKFSPYLCGLRKNYNAQYSLLTMIENWKKQLDNGKKVGVIFMDFSKAFDAINYSLLLAKLKAYGFSDQALSLLQCSLCNSFQRSIINSSFGSWNEVITGVPQCSILGPLFFKILLNDIFLFISKCQLYNYADDSILYKSGKNVQKIKNDLEMDFTVFFSFFSFHFYKCHYIVICEDDPSHKIIQNNSVIANSTEEKLLDILLDSKLNLDSHITFLCEKSGQKLSALARINYYLTPDQKIFILNSVVKSQFSSKISIFKQCLKQHSRKSLTFDVQCL